MPYALGIMKRGRPKGYSPYAEISYQELGDWVGRKTKVLVCKKWLESIVTEPTPITPNEPTDTKVAEPEPSPIEYKITHF